MEATERRAHLGHVLGHCRRAQVCDAAAISGGAHVSKARGVAVRSEAREHPNAVDGEGSAIRQVEDSLGEQRQADGTVDTP